MSTMERALVVGGILAGLTVGVMRRTEAGPRHLKLFVAAYPQVAARNKMSCFVCHAGSDKTMRNNYGDALTKHIQAKEQDDAKIKAAFEKTEPESSAIPGKTFGDLLKLGLLPATKPVDDQQNDSSPVDGIIPKN